VGLSSWRDARDPRVRSELLGLVARIDTIIDARIRRHTSNSIIYSLNALGFRDR
jgi:hypothetical protein